MSVQSVARLHGSMHACCGRVAMASSNTEHFRKAMSANKIMHADLNPAHFNHQTRHTMTFWLS